MILKIDCTTKLALYPGGANVATRIQNSLIFVGFLNMMLELSLTLTRKYRNPDSESSLKILRTVDGPPRANACFKATRCVLACPVSNHNPVD